MQKQMVGQMLDVTAPAAVEVTVSAQRDRVWVNVNGICLFRACRIGTLVVNVQKSLRRASPAEQSQS